MSFSSDKAEIVTNQCEAYEVMKLQKQSRGHTTSGIAVEQIYEEVGEGLRHGPQPRATPPQGSSTQQMYDEVGEGLTSGRCGIQAGATPPQERSPQRMHDEVAVGEKMSTT